jgi:large subunit ribosomal protein L17
MKKRYKQKMDRLGVRDRLIINQFISLMQHGAVKTTRPKAKALKIFADKLLNLVTKSEDLHAKKRIYQLLKHNKKSKDFIEKYKDIPKRNGSYVSLINLGKRKGDNAPVCEVRILE